MEELPARDDRLLALLRGQKEVFEEIARGAPLGEVLDSLVRVLEAHFTPGVMASVLLLDEDGRQLLHGAAPSLPAEYNEAIDGLEVGPGAGSCGTAAHRREPVIVDDIATDPLWADFRDLALPHGLRACWSVPICSAEGGLLGTFAVYGARPGRPSGDDQAVLAAFVQAAAVAIERSRDHATMLREKRHAEALHEVGRAISARLDLSEIVQRATDAATELTGARFGAFFYNVYDDAGESYLLYALSGVPREAFERFAMPRNTEIFGPTFAGEAPVRLADVTADPRYGRNAPYNGMPHGHLPVRSYLAVPVITTDGEVAGGLFFGHPDPDVFDGDAERLAVGIAGHAAIGIENARLYDAAQREIAARRRAFEERDHVARVLQESLLPPELPQIPGLELGARYRACTQEIGGDFYDVFSLHGDRWGIAIGDVCGKGAEAAALTALARHSLRAAAVIDPRPSEVLRVLNATLLEAHGGGRFCTAVFAVLAGRQLTVARGGHPPALVRQAGRIGRAGGAGTLLGVFGEVDFENETVELAAGDAVLLYTDGLTEIRRDGRLVEDDWVAGMLADHRGSAQGLADRLTDRAVEMSGGASVRDDIAVLTALAS